MVCYPNPIMSLTLRLQLKEEFAAKVFQFKIEEKYPFPSVSHVQLLFHLSCFERLKETKHFYRITNFLWLNCACTSFLFWQLLLLFANKIIKKKQFIFYFLIIINLPNVLRKKTGFGLIVHVVTCFLRIATYSKRQESLVSPKILKIFNGLTFNISVSFFAG